MGFHWVPIRGGLTSCRISFGFTTLFLPLQLLTAATVKSTGGAAILSRFQAYRPGAEFQHSSELSQAVLVSDGVQRL